MSFFQSVALSLFLSLLISPLPVSPLIACIPSGIASYFFNESYRRKTSREASAEDKLLFTLFSMLGGLLVAGVFTTLFFGIFAYYSAHWDEWLKFDTPTRLMIQSRSFRWWFLAITFFVGLFSNWLGSFIGFKVGAGIKSLPEEEYLSRLSLRELDEYAEAPLTEQETKMRK
jgi:putative flippase GtrA